ncbi:MAG TPA: glycosyltransferase family 2 protein, partial [Acidimicrobiales bacterium]|nr:glycosyltransferase family 2 protein [Acidimicrobiales bacterium]
LPDARVVRLEDNPGYGRAVNAVLDEATATSFALLCHDDVELEPDAVRLLVEEAFRSNAGIVGPKITRWDDRRALLSAGEGADKFGFPVPYVERGELDQEQHDSVRDVFVVPDACTLVRADLLRALGGFDPGASLFGDDLDLCWRAQIAGARVLVAPAAQVAHLEALGTRRLRDDRRRLQFRHRLRTLLVTGRPFTLLRVLPQLVVVHLAEILIALVTGRPGQAADVASSWTWNLRRLGQVRARRRQLATVRRVPDGDIRRLQVRGSARIAAFVRGQIGGGDGALGQATGVGRRMLDALRGPGRRDAMVAWGFVVLVLLFGSRHLLTRPLPAIGELAPLGDVGSLFTAWSDGWRHSGLGEAGWSPTAPGLLALGGALLGGATGLLRTVLVLGALPVGLIGAWRLAAPLRSARASSVTLVAYASVPLAYDAIATGSARGLTLYALAPWVVARVLRASGTAPFGRVDPGSGGPDTHPAGPVTTVPPLWRQVLALGLLIALGAAVDPLLAALPLVVWVGFLPGSLLVARFRGTLRSLVVAIGAAVVAVLLHLPWAIELARGGATWSTFTGGRTTDAPTPTLGDLVRFDTGPTGSALLNAAVLVAATYVLLVGRGWRFDWAVRAWTLALSIWGLVFAAGQGWLPIALPRTDLLLAPAAVGIALAVGLGVAAFELDVRRARFTWRQLAGLVAGGALTLALLPVLGASIGGRWEMPRGDVTGPLAFIPEESGDDPTRILWIGAPDVLPLVGWPLTADMAYATSAGLPTATDLWPTAAEPLDAPVGAALDIALDGGTSRLGRLLGTMGVRYVVVVEQLAPAPFGGPSAPAPPRLLSALAEQLDLEEVEVNPELVVYRNAAWVPPRAEVAADALPAADSVAAGLAAASRTALDGADPALDGQDLAPARGTLDGGGDLVVAAGPSSRWRLEVDGSRAPRREVLGWANAFAVPEGGPARLELHTPPVDRAVAAGQVAAWALVIVVLGVTRAERRELRRPVGAPPRARSRARRFRR